MLAGVSKWSAGSGRVNGTITIVMMRAGGGHGAGSTMVHPHWEARLVGELWQTHVVNTLVDNLCR